MTAPRWKDTLPKSAEASLTEAVQSLAHAVEVSNVSGLVSWVGLYWRGGDDYRVKGAAADIRAYRKSLGVGSHRVEVNLYGMSDEQVLWWAMRNVTLAAITERPEAVAVRLRHAEAYLRELWKRGERNE